MKNKRSGPIKKQSFIVPPYNVDRTIIKLSPSYHLMDLTFLSNRAAKITVEDYQEEYLAQAAEAQEKEDRKKLAALKEKYEGKK